MQSKMPIPKTLPERSTAPATPVSIGGGVSHNRPTMGSGMGIAGGNRSVDVVESERNLEPDVGVVGVMTPSAAMADWKKGGTRMACNERRFLGITDSLAVADLICGR